MRWLSQVGLTGSEQPPMGCFDWDPFVYLLGHDIDMVQQDVPAMLDAVFSIIDAGEASQQRIEIPPATDEQQLSRCLAVRRYRVSSQRAVCSSVTEAINPAAFKGGRGSPVVYVLHRQRQSAGSGSGGYHSW